MVQLTNRDVIHRWDGKTLTLEMTNSGLLKVLQAKENEEVVEMVFDPKTFEKT